MRRAEGDCGESKVDGEQRDIMGRVKYGEQREIVGRVK